MKKRRKDRVREDRIHNEAIVDAYGPEEQAMGWYYYLENKLRFPFHAKCVAANVVSPLLHPKNESGDGPTTSTSGEVINAVRNWTTGSKLKKSSFKMKPSTKRPLRCSVSPDPLRPARYLHR